MKHSAKDVQWVVNKVSKAYEEKAAQLARVWRKTAILGSDQPVNAHEAGLGIGLLACAAELEAAFGIKEKP